MADGVAITAGAGTNIATDDVGGFHHQRVKVVWGPDGTINDADVASGKPIPVQLRGSDGTDRSNALPVQQSGTWTVQPGNTANTTPWLSKLHDGTNAVAVKAASTAPGATDPALVVAISPNSVNSNGQTTMANSAPVVLPSNQGAIPVTATLVAMGMTTPANALSANPPKFKYQKVAASTSATLVGGASGASGDYLSHVNVFPTSTSLGSITLYDNTTSVTIFAGGASALSNLVPFMIPWGAQSVSGAYKLDNSTGLVTVGIGSFT